MMNQTWYESAAGGRWALSHELERSQHALRRSEVAVEVRSPRQWVQTVEMCRHRRARTRHMVKRPDHQLLLLRGILRSVSRCEANGTCTKSSYSRPWILRVPRTSVQLMALSAAAAPMASH